MNIKILDSWLREYLKTDATPKQIADSLSLTSAGIEHVEKWHNDWLYDVEITTNRPDMASVVGLAREAGAVLPQFHYEAKFLPPVIARNEMTKQSLKITSSKEKVPLEIKNDPKLVNRVMTVVIEVTKKDSPDYIKDRLEASDIRSLNNLIDITNYTMRTIGYPTHIMDYDRLGGKSLTIREAKKGEQVTTLDEKTYTLPGGDIVAENAKGEIVDLLGIMGLQNSVVTDETKRIVFFINNDNPQKIRKTSMTLGIRTEAAQLNEKELDAELVEDALLFGIRLFEELADGKVVSDIIDIYPNKPEKKVVSVTEDKINRMLGIDLPIKEAGKILEKLGFTPEVNGSSIKAIIPTHRLHDVTIPEDLVEEIARVYGYQNIPDSLPPLISEKPAGVGDAFSWERRVKYALKYWGFTEVYTYPMVSENMYEGPLENAVKLKNPLGEEFAYMRRSLVPSLLRVIEENKKHETIKIFEIGNVYESNGKHLPAQIQKFAGIIKADHASFYELKGVLEQISTDLGIKNLSCRALSKSGLETEILLGKNPIGTIEILDESLINFELNFEEFIAGATSKKSFKPLQKYPPVIEDLSLIIDPAIPTGEVIEAIQKSSQLIVDVSLLDKYDNSRTFHMLYQDPTKNLTMSEVGEIREKTLKILKEKYHATLKA